jgi:hypothetical protein
MAETKKITSLYVVTDSENSHDKIGDIDWGMFDEQWLRKYIASHGTAKLLNKLGMMTRQILNTEIEMKNEELSYDDLYATKQILWHNNLNNEEKDKLFTQSDIIGSCDPITDNPEIIITKKT